MSPDFIETTLTILLPLAGVVGFIHGWLTAYSGPTLGDRPRRERPRRVRIF